jgi:hypothetical protein
MERAVYPTLIAIWISVGAALFLCLGVAIRSRHGAAIGRDPAVSIMSGIMAVLTGLHAIAATFLAVWGMAYIGLEKAALLLTAAFAAVGMVIGLMRGLRSGRVARTQGA